MALRAIILALVIVIARTISGRRPLSSATALIRGTYVKAAISGLCVASSS